MVRYRTGFRVDDQSGGMARYDWFGRTPQREPTGLLAMGHQIEVGGDLRG
jgi:hypothetical protein